MQRTLILLTVSFILSLAGCSQNNSKKAAIKPGSQKEIKVGGSCEGCEAIYESYVSFDKLSYIDTLPDFNEQGPKIEISGIIYQQDGKTPAPGVILYVYHTDQAGLYSKKGNVTGWGKRHGYIRGWMKTNEKGEYKFYTLKPAAYPGRNIPAHIHPVIKEPGKTEYWIDEYLFDDDSLLTTEEREKNEGRGGNGIIMLEEKDGMFYGKRNIYLGRKIPDYPKTKLLGLQSGLDPGDNCPAFDPLHLSGADKGKHTCPMCKYGYQQGVMVWFNHTDLNRIKNFAKILESEMERRGEKYLRVFLIYMNPSWKNNDETGQNILQGKIEKWCTGQNLQRVAVLWVPSPVDKKTCGVFKINPEVINTVFVYKKRKVAAKWIDIDYSDESVNAILKKIDTPAI
jgi:protocatechuate 3,4-dioxygenase, beta subunit